ncbi:riboflavin biosynthesis protein RibF [Evansella clarkii]|uniref:riboflavin biosynthesis protein RibF n=1 Tax=Evansella clarkii TaxID=79879 RepID=UPI003B846565
MAALETIYTEHPDYPGELPDIALALGFFDGVHKGHKEVILKAKEEAEKRGFRSGVMTFFPHPKEVLRGEKVNYLTTLADKQKLIEDLGIDYLIVVKFNKNFSELTPQQFVDDYLIRLNVKHVVAGFDYSYGRLGKGTMETLPFHSRGKLTASVVEKVTSGEEKISSTNIRTALSDGNIEKVNKYLDRVYSVSGKVVEGEQRGRTIGFPTANVKPIERSCVPGTGVYVTELYTEGKWHRSICNIGYKPTFHDSSEGEPVIEVHILDFNKYIYGEEVAVRWHRKLRGEIKFSSVEDLIKQLHKDADQARDFFEKHS